MEGVSILFLGVYHPCPCIFWMQCSPATSDFILQPHPRHCKHLLNMSQPPPSSSMEQNSQTTPPTDSYDFKVIFEAALEAYNKKTKKCLEGHPLLTQLESCNSPAAILDLLRCQVNLNADEGLKKWLSPTINVLCAFSATIGGGVGPVNTNECVADLTLMAMRQIFSPSIAIFAGIGVLLLVSELALFLRVDSCNVQHQLGG